MSAIFITHILYFLKMVAEMKKILWATTALLGVVSWTGVASAQDSGFTVRVGGDAFFEFGYIDQERDAGLRDTEFRNRFRLLVTPSFKADNGLEYGARLRLRTVNAGNVEFDRSYLFLGGSFGRFEGGDVPGINYRQAVFHPYEWGTRFTEDDENGDYPAFLAITGLAPTTYWAFQTETTGTRLAYYSPRIAGLQVGASYQPSTNSTGIGVDRTKTAVPGTSVFFGDVAGAYRDVWEVGAQYQNVIRGFNVSASGGYIAGEAQRSSVTGVRFKPLNSYQLGAQVGYAGFSLGGGWVWGGRSGYAKSANTVLGDQWAWNVGGQYKNGPWAVGAAYLHGRDAGSIVVPAKRNLDVYSVGAAYTIAPGFTTGVEYNYFDQDSDTVANTDKGSVVLVKANVAF